MVMNHYLYLGLILVPLAILFIPLRLVLHYRLVEGDSDFRLQVIWLGMDLSRLAMPIGRLGLKLQAWNRNQIGEGETGDIHTKETVDWWQFMPVNRQFLRYFAASRRGIEGLRWHVRIGLDDAAITAVVVGALGGMGGLISPLLQQELQIPSERIHWDIVPSFDSGSRLDMELDCILRVNVGYIMINGVFNLLRAGIMKGVDLIGQRL